LLQILTVSALTQTVPVDLTNRARGLYLLRYVSEKREEILKVVVE